MNAAGAVESAPSFSSGLVSGNKGIRVGIQ